MNGKNIFFGLCASMMIASEISAMQLVRRRIPKTMYRVNSMSPLVQKRGSFGALIWFVGVPVAICCIEEALNTCPITKMIITANRLHNEVAGIGSERCSNVYIKKEVCKNPQCCKNLHPLFAYEKRPELFCDINQGRDFLVRVKDGLQKLHNKEEEAKQLLAQDKIYIEGYQKIMGLLEHKKDCHIKQIALSDEFFDSAEAKKQSDKEYCEKIKSITLMVPKTQRYDNQQQHNQECNLQQHTPRQQDKADDGRRNDDPARDLNMLMMHAYVAKQICDSATAHSDSSSSSSYMSNMESYSSQSYRDSSFSSDSSSSSHSSIE